MNPIAIVTDSACDLAPAVLAEHHVTAVPLVVRFGLEVFEDGQLTLDEFWAKVAQSPYPPQTSQPPTGAFEAAFSGLVGAGYHVICPVISSKISGTFNSAYAAAQRFAERVTIFATQTWSLAQGYQVLAAAKAAADMITSSNLRDGVAEALEQWLLGGKSLGGTVSVPKPGLVGS